MKKIKKIELHDVKVASWVNVYGYKTEKKSKLINPFASFRFNEVKKGN